MPLILSRVRTDKLKCRDCGRSLKKGELAVFNIDSRFGKFRGAWCEDCAPDESHDGDPMDHEHDTNVDICREGP